MLKTFLIVMLVGKNPPVFCFKFLLCSKPWIKLLYILNRKMFFLESVPFMKNGWNRRLYFSFHFFISIKSFGYLNCSIVRNSASVVKLKLILFNCLFIHVLLCLCIAYYAKILLLRFSKEIYRYVFQKSVVSCYCYCMYLTNLCHQIEG